MVYRETVTFENAVGEEIPAVIFMNPDGSIGGLVAATAQIAEGSFVAASAIVGPDAVVGPGMVVYPHMQIDEGEIYK